MSKRAKRAKAAPQAASPTAIAVYVPPPVLPGQLRLPHTATPLPGAVIPAPACAAPPLVPPDTKSDSYAHWERALLAGAELDNWGPETPPALRPPPPPPSSVPYPPARPCTAHAQALCVVCAVSHQHARLAKGTLAAAALEPAAAAAVKTPPAPARTPRKRSTTGPARRSGAARPLRREEAR
jgi:hypothetical protein